MVVGRGILVSLRDNLIGLVTQLGVIVIRFVPRFLWLRIRDASAIVARMDYAKAPITISVDSWVENKVRLYSCAKEPSTIEWIEAQFKPGDVFYDIGANIGAYSLVAFGFLAGNTNVYSFEPGFATFPQLAKNIYLNNASHSITPFQIALSDRTGIINFHYQNLLSGGALHALGEPLDYQGTPFTPVFTLPTLSYRLDDFIEKFNLPLPNHIKIDVDGTEYNILQGASKVLCSPQLRTVLLETDPNNANARSVTQLLEQNGLLLRRLVDGNSLYFRNA